MNFTPQADHGSWFRSANPLASESVSLSGELLYQPSRSLLFIDAAIEDSQWFAQGVAASTEVHWLQPGSDAIAQITQTLLGRTGIASLQIIAHGQAGGIQLGNSWLNGQTLANAGAAIQSWGIALTPSADILLYGCNVAQGAVGQAFVQQLAQITGADVAASDDLTGQGGDWTLEVQTGEIESRLEIAAPVLQRYHHQLAAPILNNSGTPILPAIASGTAATSITGITVSDLLSQLAAPISDADGDPKAIAITGVDNTNGTWQYSTNGTTWNPITTTSDANATLLGATAFYTADLGTAPTSQGWLSYTAVKLPALGLPSFVTNTESINGGAVVDTTADRTIYAGYSNYGISGALVNANAPRLDNTTGYSLSFDLQVLADANTNPSRAGFSVLLVSQDPTKAIELAFQRLTATTGQIFAQSSAFAAAEAIAYDTNQKTDYRIAVRGNSYQVFANGTQILTGALRDYSGFTPPANFPADPYEQANLVFLGDNSTSAQGSFKLTQVVMQTENRLRYVPNANTSGNATINFRAWDTTDGKSSGAIVNAATNGTGTPFSSNFETATVTVNPVVSNAKSEILWRNDQTNLSVVWNIQNGTQLVAGRLLTYGSNVAGKAGQAVLYDQTWRLVNTIDLNGDGGRDLVYTRDGEIRVLTVGQVSGQTTTITADREFTFASPKFNSLNGQAAKPLSGWELVGVEDMTGDGQGDFVFYSRSLDLTVIWQTNSAGQIVDGVVVTSAASPGGQNTGAPNAWNVQALGDFTGDGKIDMLWRNTANVVVLWELNGTQLSYAKSGVLPSLGSNFQVKGVGDFNQDGVKDIIWRDQTNNVSRIWTFGPNGRPTDISLLAATSSQWEIGDVADMNGDGTDDIIWRNNQENNVVVWNIQNAAFSLPGSGYVLNYLPGGNQQVINPGGIFWKIDAVTATV
jgi:Domain of unknown function (DUF4347)/FG-GAP-like repeat